MIADTADENKYGEILRPDVRLDDRFCTEQNEKEKLEGCLVQVTEDLVCERQQRRELEDLVFSQKATISELLEDEGQSLYEGSEVRDQLEAFVMLSQELYTQAQELIKFLTHSEETHRNQAAELQNEKGKLEGRLVQLTQDLVCERQQRRELEDLVFSQRATISELLEEKEQSLNNGSEVRDQLKACILLNQGFKAQVQEFMKVLTHCEETHRNQTAEGEKTSVKPVACATESGVTINNEVSVNFPSPLLAAAPIPVVSAPTPNMPQATSPVEAEALQCLGHYLMLPVRTKTEKNRQKRTRYKMNKRMKKAAEGEKTSVKPVACATESGVTINNEVSVNFPSQLLAAAPIPVVSAPTPNMPQATNLDEAEALRLLARYLMLPVRTKTEKNRQKRTRYKMNKRMKKAAEVACESDCQPHGVITVPGIFTSPEQQYDNPVPECMQNADNPQYEMLPEERSEKLPDALDTKDETVKDIEKLLSTFQEKLFDLEKQLLLEQHQRQEMDFDKHDVDTELIGLNDELDKCILKLKR